MFLHSTRRVSRSLCAAFLFAAAGCVQNHYEIQMRPEGDQLRRSMIVWRERAHTEEPTLEAFPQDELNAIARVYGEAPPASEARQYRFGGTFAGETPQDVGGSGDLTHWKTSLGTLFVYAERYRGSDDLAASLADRRAAAESVADLLAGWFRAELDDDPGWEQFEIFLREQLRPDLDNLALYAWTHSAIAAAEFTDGQHAGAPHSQDFFVRIARYFIEREYVQPEDMPRLLRAVEQEDTPRMLQFARSLIAARMGIADVENAKRRLAFLSGSDVATDSLRRYVETTDAFREHLESWRREHAADPEATPPEPLDFVADVTARMLSFQPRPYDRLRVTLECPQQPFATNGLWDASEGAVVWSAEINPRDAGPAPVLPVVLYAAWSTPNAEVQRRRFGKVILDGKALGDYCRWRAGLDPDEAREWEQFLSSLSPGGNPGVRLEEFRFSKAPQPPEEQAGVRDLAATPRKLIQEGLGR